MTPADAWFVVAIRALREIYSTVPDPRLLDVIHGAEKLAEERRRIPKQSDGPKGGD